MAKFFIDYRLKWALRGAVHGLPMGWLPMGSSWEVHEVPMGTHGLTHGCPMGGLAKLPVVWEIIRREAWAGRMAAVNDMEARSTHLIAGFPESSLN